MVCNTWSHWLSGLYPSSGILNTKKNNVSEEKSSYIFLFPLLETLFFLVFGIPDDTQNPVTPSVIHHDQNSSECNKKTGSLEN
jgi:hypothetical protein